MTSWPSQSENRTANFILRGPGYSRPQRRKKRVHLVLDTVEEAKSLEAQETEQSGRRFVMCLERLRNAVPRLDEQDMGVSRIPEITRACRESINSDSCAGQKGLRAPLPAIMGTPHRRSSAHERNIPTPASGTSPSKFATAKRKKNENIPTCAHISSAPLRWRPVIHKEQASL